MKTLIKQFSTESKVLLLLRLILGTIFFAHGAQKVLGWFGGNGLELTANYFEQNLGIPTFLTYIASFTELLGGLGLLFGILTKISAAGIGIVMLAAILKVHLPNGFFMPGGFEFALTLFLIALVVLLRGPGTISIDSKLFNKNS
jgi:putative oxidoreductase